MLLNEHAQLHDARNCRTRHFCVRAEHAGIVAAERFVGTWVISEPLPSIGDGAGKLIIYSGRPEARDRKHKGLTGRPSLSVPLHGPGSGGLFHSPTRAHPLSLPGAVGA